MGFPEGPNPLLLEDGSACFQEHCAQLLPADRGYVFCGCPVVDTPGGRKEIPCERVLGLDYDPHGQTPQP